MPHWKKADPHHGRETELYGEALPSREYIMELLGAESGPVTRERLHELLGIDDEDEIDRLRRRLRAMERDGQILRNRRGAFGLVSRMDLVRGRVQGHKDGFGFVIPDDGSDDLYLHARQMRRVLDGDRVLAREAGQDRRGRREGVIVEVLERGTTTVVGRYYREKDVSFVVPDNRRIHQDILIPPEARNGARHGKIVVAEITQHPTDRNGPIGQVAEVLGDHLAPGMEVEIAVRNHSIPHEFPAPVLREAERLPDEVRKGDKAHRVDLRDLPLVTIDGEDARDFDDAVYCEPLARGAFRLVVAIADVSHYVRVAGKLDAEASKRGTSVYFPGQVIPMLPEKLSNGLCSLNPDVDRLCMVADLRISGAGKITGYQFSEGVMRSRARLTYTTVGALLAEPKGSGAKAFRKKHAELEQNILDLHRLYKVLRAARDKRGAIDFETIETRVVFGENRKIERIVPVERNDAHKLIEECMLSANVAAARFLMDHKLEGLYRVHDGPKTEKVEALRQFLGEFGLSLGGGDKPRPAHYQKLAQQIEERPDRHLIQTVMLRSMQQAVYSPENIGHFGLDYPAYAHFTSPIRRYPDLLVHRAIRSVIRSDQKTKLVQRSSGAKALPLAKIYPYDRAALEALGEHCSTTERRADEATRDAMDTLKCEYMLDHVGDRFDGTISAVTGFGIFVQLDEVYVEGLVHITALGSDYYHFDAVKHRLLGERTRTAFRLGDRVRVLVARVDVEEARIDLELDQKKPAPKGTKGKKTSRGRRSGKKR